MFVCQKKPVFILGNTASVNYFHSVNTELLYEFHQYVFILRNESEGC